MLLDRSASMQRGDLWARAKAKVQTALGQLGPGDRFSLIAYDDSNKPLAQIDSWLGSASGGEVNAQLERLAKPGFGGSNLGQALVSVGEAIHETETEEDEQPFARREIIVISDLQKGSRLNEVQGYEWPAEIRVTLEQIGDGEQGNAGIEQVASRVPWAANGGAPSFRISNSPSGISDELEFVAHTAAGDAFSQKVHVPPGRSRVVELPAESAGKPIARLAIRGDAAAFETSFISRQSGSRPCASFTSARTIRMTPRARCFTWRARFSRRVRLIFRSSPSAAFRLAHCRRPICTSSAMPSATRLAKRLARRSRGE
ncbi:MAG: hypothetical protein CM1200mP34_2600 [Verrucomicrobiales bacterium]|nr:MAG: hypothetical protein CM1200mP34_2600 [Verrucomicrobiales bacterium]